MKLIKYMLRRSSFKFVLAMLAGLVAGISNTVLLGIIGAALGEMGPTSLIIWGFVALGAIMIISRVISEVLLVRMSLRSISDMRIYLSRQILAAPMRHLEELGPHRILTTLTEDAPIIINAVASFPLICMHGAVVATCLIYLGLLSWKLLLGVLVFMAVGIATYQLPLIRATRFLDLAREEWDALFKHYRALTEGLKELKLHQRRQESFIRDLLSNTSESFIKFNVTGSTIYSIASGWGHLLIFVLIGLLVFAGGSLVGVDKPTLTGYAIIILYMMTPLEVIINTLPIFGRADIALKKVEDLGLSLVQNTKESIEAIEPAASGFAGLDVRAITHTYYREGEEEKFVLGPIDLSLKAGELVFIVGPNGCGKTTLAKLLIGLYTPESGEILLDGRAVTDESRNSYRQLFSVVFSDFFLFEQLLGLERPELDEHARDYIRRLQLSHKVQVKDGGLSTTDLSQGQRKRLALLTAYLENRQIYVFDEWAADQDPMFKNVFYHQLLPDLRARGKTVVVITHDDRYFGLADRLIKLEDGQLEFDKPVAAMHAPAAASD